MHWEIRVATSEDLPYIVDLIRMGVEERTFHNRVISVEGFREHAFESRQKGYDIILYQIRNEIVGYMDFLVGNWGVGHILGIYVKIKHRRNGIGKKLMDKLLDEFMKSNCHKARVEVFANNQGAIRFYTNLNFVQEGYLQKDEDKRDVIIMSRFLEEPEERFP